MLFIGTLCISIVITAFILAFKTSNMWSGSVDDHHRRLQLISNQAFYMFAAVFAQGNPQPPVSVILRIIHAFYLIFLVIIVVAYTSQLVALIAVTKITLPLNSFKELAESPSYKVSIPEGTYSELPRQDLYLTSGIKRLRIIQPTSSHPLLKDICVMFPMFVPRIML